MAATMEAEVEIDLGESSGSEDSRGEEEPRTLWRAPNTSHTPDEEEDIHTCTRVEISDTKPLLDTRDPRGVHDALKVTFEDVIAEPTSVRSGDRVWFWSHALFEVTRIWTYRVVTAALAVPAALLGGLLFAFLSCVHIWTVGPCLRCLSIGTSWLQNLWNVALGVMVRPLLASAGGCCGGFRVHLSQE